MPNESFPVAGGYPVSNLEYINAPNPDDTLILLQGDPLEFKSTTVDDIRGSFVANPDIANALLYKSANQTIPPNSYTIVGFDTILSSIPYGNTFDEAMAALGLTANGSASSFTNNSTETRTYDLEVSIGWLPDANPEGRRELYIFHEDAASDNTTAVDYNRQSFIPVSNTDFLVERARSPVSLRPNDSFYVYLYQTETGDRSVYGANSPDSPIFVTKIVITRFQ